jgi:hypothetical protein
MKRECLTTRMRTTTGTTTTTTMVGGRRKPLSPVCENTSSTQPVGVTAVDAGRKGKSTKPAAASASSKASASSVERLAALQCVDALLTDDDDAGKENDDGDDDGFTFRTADGVEGDDAMMENDDAPVFSGGGQTVSFFESNDDDDDADDAREKYEETVGLLRAQTVALKRAHGVTVALEAELADEKARASALERDARERMRDVRREMETLRVTLNEVVESARAASEGKVCEKARADALEGELRRAREEHRRDIESASAELALVRASANASRSGRDDASEAAMEKLKASEAKAKKDAQRAREALMEQKKTSEALEKRLRETRSRADLAEAKCRELKTTQKRWERLEASGDAVFLKSPASSATPGTLRESHREVRAYAARRVEKLEREASDTRRESGVAAANLDARLAAESVARGAAQGSLESARSRIRVLEGECEALRAKAREAAQEVADLNMALKLAEERAAQAEETSAKEIASVMDRVRATERTMPADGRSGGVYSPASTSVKTNDASLLARAERAEARARDAEDQLQSLRHAARSASQHAVDALSPASSERKTRSRTEPLRRAEEPESLPPRTPTTTASNGRRANRQSNRARAAANELLSSLRHKLEASSPSGARRIARRVDDASDRSDDEYEEIDPAYMTPRRSGG